MKKYIIIVLVSILSISLFAQPSSDIREQQRGERYRQIQNAKIAFFTTEIGMTPSEAEVFWPIYNQYWKEREVVMRKGQSLLKQISESASDEKNTSSKELKRLMDAFVNCSYEESQIHKKYYDKFLKILPIEKIAKMYKAEEEFRIKMIRQFRGHSK